MIADWDYLVGVGIIVMAVGLWLLWGPGAALLAVGLATVLFGLGGAMTRR